MLLDRVARTLRELTRNRDRLGETARMLIPASRGARYADNFSPAFSSRCAPAAEANPLQDYIDRHDAGPGIWKWTHYPEIYHRHFQKFVGTDVHVMEIGIFSGGSLDMWRHYFGPRCRVIGVDIEPACRVYRSPGVDVMIGDQSDRRFWAKVRTEHPRVDILIDDGGHHPEHQIITFEEMLPHLSPGGVYLCEDVHGAPNYFSSYLAGLSGRLNSGSVQTIAGAVDSVHLYPFVAVIEKRVSERPPLRSEKRGTEWQPFLDGA